MDTPSPLAVTASLARRSAPLRAPRRRLLPPDAARVLRDIPPRSDEHALLLVLVELSAETTSARVRERSLGRVASDRYADRFAEGGLAGRPDAARVRATLERLARTDLARCDGARRWHPSARTRAGVRAWRAGKADAVVTGDWQGVALRRERRVRRMVARVQARLRREDRAKREARRASRELPVAA